MPIGQHIPGCHTPELARARYRIARDAGHEHACAIEYGKSDVLSLRDVCICLKTLVRVSKLRERLRQPPGRRGPSALTRLTRRLA